MRAGALILTAALALAAQAGAQVDPGAPEGAHRTVQSVRDLDGYALPVGQFGLDRPAVRRLEGAVARSAWRLDAPEATVAGVMQGYRQRLQAMGFEPLFECAGEACGGFDFRFGAEILPPPDMLVDVRDFAQLSVGPGETQATESGAQGYVSVLVSRVMDTIYVQTVAVAPETGAAGATGAPDTPDPATPADAPDTPPDPPGPGDAARAPAAGEEATPAAAPLATPDEAAGAEEALGAQLTRDGHVPVHGLDFEVGGERLSPGSAAALDGLARMLSAEGAPSVVVVGHSDNRGALDMNIELSRRRAEAVRRALIERGVPADRLEARGVGFLAPVASNATELGRALNRRVELVLR